MSTTVTCTGNVVVNPELLQTRAGKPFAGRHVLENQVENDDRECVNDEPTAHDGKVYGPAATNVHDTCSSEDPILVQSLKRTKRWPNTETGDRRTKNLVVVDSGFGEVGNSLRCVSARTECATAQIG